MDVQVHGPLCVHLHGHWGPPLVLSFMPPQVLPTLLFLSETLSLTSLEFAK